MKQEELSKRIAGEKAVEFINDEMVIGLGTGTTVYWAIQKLGKLVSDGLRIRAIPTSSETEKLANEAGIPLITFEQLKKKKIDLTIDGADEISPQFDMIKGGGGALLREKLVALSSQKRIYIADSTKLVQHLGNRALPIEIIPFSWEQILERVALLGCSVSIRKNDDHPFITDNGNFILDCKFPEILRPLELHQKLKLLPGVIETGLFVQLADLVVIGYPNRFEILHPGIT